MNVEEKPYLQDLFDHMRNEHGLILLQSEMQEIVSVCNTDLSAENEKLREALRELIEQIDKCPLDLSSDEKVEEATFLDAIKNEAKQLITEP